MQQPKVSVIVPVYNAEKYISKCVDSILGQTFKDFEIILVDDGSPDGSGVICDEYALRDSRIRVIHKANGGVSSARQCGLDNARGEYTIHADPDDWVEPDMLEALYAKAKAEDADMVICDFYVNDSRGQRYVRQQPSALDHETVLCELFQQLHGSCWNKLVKRACYKEYEVLFPLGFSLCEDLYTNVALLKHDIRISYLPQAFYHYEQQVNVNSIVKSSKKRTYEEDCRQIEGFRSLLLNLSCFNEAFSYIQSMIVIRAFYSGAYTSKEFKELYAPYRNTVLSMRDLSFRNYLFLKTSFMGYYRAAYGVWCGIKSLKSFMCYC